MRLTDFSGGNDTMTTTRPPAGLGKAGRALWRTIVDGFVLSPHEHRLLVEACRCVDELDVLVAALADAPPLVQGSTGQDRANPLFAELRQHRATLTALLDALRLPLDGEVVGRSSASRRATDAARARWSPRSEAVV